MHCSTRRHMQGITLIELLVVLAILVIWAGIGGPAMGRLLQTQRLQAASQTLYQALHYARSEAVRRGMPVLVESRQPRDWNAGWRIYVDRNGDGDRSSDEPILRVEPKPPGDVDVIANRPVARQVRYAPNGYSMRASGAFQIGSFYLCPPGRKGDARRLVLSRGGRLRIERIGADEGKCSDE